MKSILIYKNINADLECNIKNHIQNDSVPKYIDNYYKDHMPNTGNKVWFQAIAAEAESSGNHVDFLTSDMSIDYINSNYDIIIYPMANIFGTKYKTALLNIADTFNKITVPTYIISCGVQAKSYDELDALAADIGEESKRFISAIYHTGGEFALRGHFTYEFFCHILTNGGGKTTAVVTGCPSLYQRGRNLTVDTSKKVNFEQFRAVLNGSLSDYPIDFFNKRICTFIDQDSYMHPLFNRDFCQGIILNRKLCIDAIKYYGAYQLERVFSNDVQMFFETNNWYNYLKYEDISFSYGSRIHGNVMSVLAGVPTLINAKDSRVREMAELYNIPFVENNTVTSIQELYSLYLSLDYTKFNQNYPKLYDNFEHFLIEHSIVDKLDAKDPFFIIKPEEYQKNTAYPCEDSFGAALKSVKKYSGIVNAAHKLKGLISHQ